MSAELDPDTAGEELVDARGAHRVVVGVDGSSTSGQALWWATEAAAARGIPLQIVHAWSMPWLGNLPDPLVLEPIPYKQAAQEVLDAAVERARQLALSVEVQALLVRDKAAGALLAAVEGASLLVLGSHGRGWLARASTALLDEMTGALHPDPTSPSPEAVEAVSIEDDAVARS